MDTIAPSALQLEEAAGHCRLADGFLGSAKIHVGAPEFAIRNAISRAYYSLFHVCSAFLALKGVSKSQRTHHGRIRLHIAREVGAPFAVHLKEFQIAREQADYQPRYFEGNLADFEERGRIQVEAMQNDFRLYRKLYDDSLREGGQHANDHDNRSRSDSPGEA